MLYIEPYAGAAPVVHVIDDAKKNVYLNAYYMTSSKVLNALQSARARGVNVCVIIDENPYGISGAQVQQELTMLAKTGVDVKSAPSRFESSTYPYAYDHAKYVCNNHECEIGTANFDAAAFHKNREYLYVTHNSTVVRDALLVFRADWNGHNAGPVPRGKLVLSPGSTNIVTQVISQPGRVEVEMEKLGDDADIMNALAKKGGLAEIILPDNLSHKDLENCHTLSKNGVHIEYMPKSRVYMHAKMIVGYHYAFIGSQNLTSTSLTSSREMGVILSSAQTIKKLTNQFDIDWHNAG